MSNIELNVNSIKELMDKFAKLGLGKLDIEDGDFKLTLEAKQIAESVSVVSTESRAASFTQVTSEVIEEEKSGTVVTSPIVGTFYASPAPDKAPFVKVGSTVKKGDVIFIIESMKLMNEIQSEHSGVITEILVNNGSPVEFGQPILRIE